IVSVDEESGAWVAGALHRQKCLLYIDRVTDIAKNHIVERFATLEILREAHLIFKSRRCGPGDSDHFRADFHSKSPLRLNSVENETCLTTDIEHALLWFDQEPEQ